MLIPTLSSTPRMLFFAFALSLATAQADSISDARKIVVAAYKTSDAAVERKDSNTLLQLMAPDYLLINLQKKKITKNDMKMSMNKWFTRTKSMKIHTFVNRVSLKNGQIEVMAQEVAKAFTVDSRSHKQIAVVSNSSFREVWSKRNSQWLKQNTQALTQRLTVDGNPQNLKKVPKVRI